MILQYKLQGPQQKVRVKVRVATEIVTTLKSSYVMFIVWKKGTHYI